MFCRQKRPSRAFSGWRTRRNEGHRQTPEPRDLLNWKTDNAETPQNLVYGHGGFPFEAVRRALLAEQFHLCAYTMKGLKTAAQCEAEGTDTASACHIEHILPQSRRVQGEDIDYRNMLACFPPSRSREACDYGAKFKDHFDPSTTDLFTSPLSNRPEAHFAFKSDGRVTGQAAAGQATVEAPNLNHPVLVNDRAAVIKGWLTPRINRSLTAAAARRLADQMLIPDQRGCLPPYCVAIASAARAFAEREERRAVRMRNRTSR